MDSYKLKDVYWIFGLHKNYHTNKMGLVLIPFVYNEDKTAFKTLDDGVIHNNIMFKDKLGEDNIRSYCDYTLDIYNAQIIRSSFLYTTYLKLTPNVLLNKTDRSFVKYLDGKTVERKTLYEHTYNEMYSEYDILKLGKKWKRSLLRFIKNANKEDCSIVEKSK